MQAKMTVFIGVAGGGKDYQAEMLVKQGAIRVDFKDALLDMATDLVGYDVRKHYDFFKENPIGMITVENPLVQGFVIEDGKNILNKYPLSMTGRRLLQRLGTEVMRKRDKNYWTKAFSQKVRSILGEGKSVVTADCRFMNEVEEVSLVAFNYSMSSPRHRVVPEFIFCDYKSNRYSPGMDHESERLANTLLQMGLKDLQPITQEDFKEASLRMNNVAKELV